MSLVVSLFEQYVNLKDDLHFDAMIEAAQVDDPGKLADTISARLNVGVNEKQNLLEIVSPIERLNRLAGILAIEVDNVELGRRIEARVEKHVQKLRSEYWVTERKKAIQLEMDEIKTILEAKQLAQDVEEKLVRDLKRLDVMFNQMPGQTKGSPDALAWAAIAPSIQAQRESLLGGRARTPLRSLVERHKEPVMEPRVLKPELPWPHARLAFWALLGGFAGGLVLNGLHWLIGRFAH